MLTNLPRTHTNARHFESRETKFISNERQLKIKHQDWQFFAPELPPFRLTSGPAAHCNQAIIDENVSCFKASQDPTEAGYAHGDGQENGSSVDRNLFGCPQILPRFLRSFSTKKRGSLVFKRAGQNSHFSIKNPFILLTRHSRLKPDV